MSGVHRVAQEGFGGSTDAYERARPSYPDDAVAHMVERLGIRRGANVVDLAAGTGKLTRLLVPTGARIVAVEPVAAMRATLERLVPEAESREGTAESMPVDDAWADALTVAQAFHWFDAPVALAEMARVLRPGGGLGLVWNDKDDRVDWVRRLNEVIHWHDSGIPAYGPALDVPGTVAACGLFSPVEHARFHHEQPMDADLLVSRVLSTSYLAILDDRAKTRLEGEVRALVADLPSSFTLPYRTDVFTCTRP